MAGEIQDTSLEGKDVSDEYRARHSALKRCKACDRVMRPFGEKAKNWPWTVSSSPRGLCVTCYIHDIRAEGQESRDAVHLGSGLVIPPRGDASELTPEQRRAWAATWSPGQLRLANSVANAFAAAPAAALEVLSMLGLFSRIPEPSGVELSDPTGNLGRRRQR